LIWDVLFILYSKGTTPMSFNYDIIKVHGGEIKVETREGEGSEFIIQLPLS